MKPIHPIPVIRVRTTNLQPLHHPFAPVISPLPPRVAPTPSLIRTKTTVSTGASPSSKRRSITPFTDTGQVPWSSLSLPEKAARTAQQSFNFGLILVGVVMTGGVAYFLWGDVFSPDSKTAHFNRAVDRIKADHRCISALGPAKELLAHGDETYNKWRRARPIQSTIKTDKQGRQHLIMHFYMEGPRNRGTVMLHMVKDPRTGEDYEYKYLYVDVPGHERIYLENADAKPASGSPGDPKKFKFLGVSWA